MVAAFFRELARTAAAVEFEARGGLPGAFGAKQRVPAESPLVAALQFHHQIAIVSGLVTSVRQVTFRGWPLASTFQQAELRLGGTTETE